MMRLLLALVLAVATAVPATAAARGSVAVGPRRRGRRLMCAIAVLIASVVLLVAASLAHASVIFDGDLDRTMTPFTPAKQGVGLDPTLTTSPACDGNAAKLTLGTGNVTSRSQLDSAPHHPIGSTIYAGFATFIPANYSNPKTWHVLWEMHGKPYSGSNPVGLGMLPDGRIELHTHTNGSDKRQPWVGTFERGRWVDVVVGMHLSRTVTASGPAGWVELYVDGVQQPLKNPDGSLTMRLPHQTVANDQTKGVRVIPTHYSGAGTGGTLYHDEITVGTTLADVQTHCRPGSAPPPDTQPTAGAPEDRIDGDVQAVLAGLAPGEAARVIVEMRTRVDPAALGGGRRAERLERIVRRLREHAATDQAPARALIDGEAARGRVRAVMPLWIANAIALEATAPAIRAVARLPRVARVSLDRTLLAPAFAEAGISLTRAPEVWTAGARGQRVVVANLDTGVDYLHPDLAASWRGGANSWYDPSGQHPTSPFDANGHGTSTMGVILGGSAGGTDIGVAPAARWIAAKVFDDAGATTVSRIHQAFQWVLDPDRNPATDDAPHVVNSSWAFEAPGCDLAFEPDIAALRAVDILPVFSAGNAGPSEGSSRSPANNPGAVAVGAVDGGSLAAPFSSRGPSACAGDESYPDVAAPGVSIWSADLFDQYRSTSGTSMAAAHVSGALALMLTARPLATAAEQEAALRYGAYDLGAAGVDNDHGTGRLDAMATYDLAVASLPPVSPGPAPPELFLSRAASGPTTIGGVTGVAGEDVLSYGRDGFAMLFDGSDVGLAGVNVEAFARLDADSFLLSFGANVTLPGVGLVERFDVVRFDASSLGPQTAGAYSWYVDGSDVGLSLSGEQIDAIEVLPDGRVLISPVGTISVPGASGAGEDLLALRPTSLGATTAGTWTVYFDGSDVALTGTGEKVDAAAVGPDGLIELSTSGAFAVPGLSGSADDGFACSPVATGPTTACNWWVSPVFDGAPWGLGLANVDALEVP